MWAEHVETLERALFSPEHEFDLIHLSEPAFCHLNPVRLEVVLVEAPKLPRSFHGAIHEYRESLSSSRADPPNQSVAWQEVQPHGVNEKVVEHGLMLKPAERHVEHPTFDPGEAPRCRTCLFCYVADPVFTYQVADDLVLFPWITVQLKQFMLSFHHQGIQIHPKGKN